MFGLFASQHQKTRRLASDWLELAEKVFSYRKDVMSEAERGELSESGAAVRQLLREKADTAKLKLGIDALERVLRRHGGTHYPKSWIVENVEFLLVAAIVILGLRAFYVQPFKIPTNSMWPSYYGMTGDVFKSKSEEPGPLQQVVRFAAFGAKTRRVDAPETGEILLPLGGGPHNSIVAHVEAPGRAWGVLPTTVCEYALVVGSRLVKVRVPSDFDMDWVLRDIYFPGEKRSLREIATAEDNAGRLVEASITTDAGVQRGRFLRTGKIVRAGERMLSFDILTGDQLFVDRVSYHFVRPKAGDGFVFRTDNIHSPYMSDRKTRRQVESYYIKRLVGVPGDTLKIENYTLYRNGAPIEGSPAFDKNARQADRYVGYRNEGTLAVGSTVSVPDNSYLALGDNSANSLDGRFWGFVPAKDVVGRPLFIYYPFTKRWGPAP